MNQPTSWNFGTCVNSSEFIGLASYSTKKKTWFPSTNPMMNGCISWISQGVTFRVLASFFHQLRCGLKFSSSPASQKQSRSDFGPFTATTMRWLSVSQQRLVARPSNGNSAAISQSWSTWHGCVFMENIICLKSFVKTKNTTALLVIYRITYIYIYCA